MSFTKLVLAIIVAYITIKFLAPIALVVLFTLLGFKF